MNFIGKNNGINILAILTICWAEVNINDNDDKANDDKANDDNDNPDGKCRAGDKSGITFKYDDAGKKIDMDCYYYKGNAGTGSKCL